jgi:hypothetical protein
MARLLHPALLDSLVLATEEEEQLPAWEALLSPEGAEAWEQALSRRQRLDTLADVVRDRPWLAWPLLVARRLARRMKAPPPLRVEALLGSAELGAMLGPQEEARVLPLTWGHIEPHTVEPGTHVRLQLQAAAEPVELFFARAGESAPLSSGAWDLEPGEAPVLLLACVGARGARNAEEALAMATAAAGLILLEAPTREGEGAAP